MYHVGAQGVDERTIMYIIIIIVIKALKYKTNTDTSGILDQHVPPVRCHAAQEAQCAGS